MIPRSHVLKILLAALTMATLASAQTARDPAALRREVSQRFDVVPLREGVMLQPKTRIADVGSIDITNGTVAIDGAAVTGAELRDKLGADAELVLQVSYLDADGRRTFLESTAATPAATRPGLPAESPTGDTPRQSHEPPDRDPDSLRDNVSDRIRIGGSVNVTSNQTVHGDVVAVGGSARVDGEVHGNVVAIGGGVTLGPKAIVTEDVVVVGGTLHRDPAAVVKGNIKEVDVSAMHGFWNAPLGWTGPWARRLWAPPLALASTLTRVIVLLLLTALVVLFAGQNGGYIDRVGVRAAAEPLKAGAIGFLAQMLFVPILIIVVVVLVATLIGIPLLVLVPFAILALGVVALVGFTAVAQLVGRRVETQFGWADSSPYLRTTVGVIAIVTPVLIARFVGLTGGPMSALSHLLAFVGFVLEYLVWTIGFGAVALLRFQRRAA